MIFRLSERFAQQTDPLKVTPLRAIAGSKTALVSRQSVIITKVEVLSAAAAVNSQFEAAMDLPKSHSPERGAAVEVQDNSGRTALLLLAASNGQLAVAKQLVACGAQVAIRSDNGSTAEKLALEKGHLKVAEYLRTVS